MRIYIQEQNEFSWHTWFAWYPVKVPLFEHADQPDIYTYQWVWREKIERQYHFTSSQGDGQWFYRLTK